MSDVQQPLEVQTPPPANGVLLRTEKLVKEYRQRRVVNGISITVAAGEIVGLLGPNGAGKTTTFNMVVGVIKPQEGRVRFQDRDITRLPMHQRARLGIGYLTQEPSVRRSSSGRMSSHSATLPMVSCTRSGGRPRNAP